jgi:hypothetical protein
MELDWDLDVPVDNYSGKSDATILEPGADELQTTSSMIGLGIYQI